MALSQETTERTAERVRSNRLRRMAKRQGLTLRKSRRRDPRAVDYGLWILGDRQGGMGSRDLDQIELWLTEGLSGEEGPGLLMPELAEIARERRIGEVFERDRELFEARRGGGRRG